jgi:hypothetical protein
MARLLASYRTVVFGANISPATGFRRGFLIFPTAHVRKCDDAGGSDMRAPTSFFRFLTAATPFRAPETINQERSLERARRIRPAWGEARQVSLLLRSCLAPVGTVKCVCDQEGPPDSV